MSKNTTHTKKLVSKPSLVKSVKKLKKKRRRAHSFEERVIVIAGPITELIAGEVIYRLISFAHTSCAPIDIFITSPGGCVYSSFAIYDTIKLLIANGIPVCTHAKGACFSGGLIVFLGGIIRTATANTFLMMHTVAGGIQNGARPHHYKMEYDLTKEIETRIINIIEEECPLIKETERAWVDEFRNNDVYFSRQFAIDYGFVTD